MWKVHFATPKWVPGTQGCDFVCPCYGSTWIQWHDPPLMYDLTADPSEIQPINISSDIKYKDILHLTYQAKETHLDSVQEVHLNITS